MKICRYEDCPDPGQTVYPDQTEFCPRCGGDLDTATEEEVAGANRAKLPEDFVCAARLIGAAQVALAKSLLGAANIEFFLTNEITEDLLGVGEIFTGWNLVTGGVGAWVHKDDAADATELLAGLKPDQPEPKDDEAPAPGSEEKTPSA
jgi:hypothetical protein